MADVFLCVRRTIDWRDETKIDPGFRPKVEAWNATFPMPYPVFRQRLKEIAAANLARVEGATVADLAAVPPGAIVAPVDDDDWFAPDLAAELRRAEPTPPEGQETHFVDEDVLGALEPEARALLLRYVHDLARVEEHRAWRQVVQFTRAFGSALVRGGGYSSANDFEHAPLYAATAERVMHRLVEEYERHAHPRVE